MSSSNEKVSSDSAEGAQAVVETLNADGKYGTKVAATSPQGLSRKQALSAYFTIAAAAFGLIRFVDFYLRFFETRAFTVRFT